MEHGLSARATRARTGNTVMDPAQPPARVFEDSARPAAPPPSQPPTAELISSLESGSSHLAHRVERLLKLLHGNCSEGDSGSTPQPAGLNERLFSVCTQLNGAHANLSMIAAYLGVEL